MGFFRKQVSPIKIVTCGGIGDVLLITPALRAIKQESPEKRIWVKCASQRDYDVLKYNPHIDILFIPSHAATLLSFASMVCRDLLKILKIPRLRTSRRAPRFDMLLNYGRYVPSLLPLSATEVIGLMLKVNVHDRRIEILLSQEESEKAKGQMSQYDNPVVIHTASVSSTNKHWPIERWEALITRNPQFTFVQLGLNGDAGVQGAVDLRGKTSIREAFALLKYACAFVGVDSSLAHATNAFGTPAVVLFGPTVPEVWSHGNQKIMTRRARCSPCIDTLGSVPCPYGAPCLSDISVDDVQAALNEITGFTASTHVEEARARP